MTFDLQQFLGTTAIALGIVTGIGGLLLVGAHFINGWRRAAAVIGFGLIVAGILLLSFGAAIAPDSW